MLHRVRITDVAPRDGLQNEARSVPTADKVELVRRLALARVDEIEVSSFVSAKWIPQLGDARDVFAAAKEFKRDGLQYSALVPNDKGLEAAIDVNQFAGSRLIDKVSVFTAASESFAQRNTNASIAQTIDRFRTLVPRARAAGLRVRGYISCVIACPFEGPLLPRRAVEVAGMLADLGVDELDYGDTIGAATPAAIEALLDSHASAFGESHTQNPDAFTLHLHDTFGRARACIDRAIARGVRSFDGAAGGLGGCPYASIAGRPAPGNIDTRAIVEASLAAQLHVGVDILRLADAALFAQSLRAGDHP